MEPRRTSRSLSPANVVLALLFAVTAVNYLDRQTLSVVAPLLQKRISLSTIGYSRVVFLFFVGYTIGQTLDGKIIDEVGTRLGMVYCVALWSVVSMLHSLIVGVFSLGGLRFLLGVAEAGNWPGGVKAVAENFPSSQRAFGTGVFNSGSTLGAIIAPPLVALITARWGWRPMFVVIGISGLVWVVIWNKVYQRRSLPSPPRTVSAPAARSSLSHSVRQRGCWSLMVTRFFADPLWWFYAFWLPEYLAHSRGFSLARIGETAWIPFFFAGVGGWLGGLASDALVRRGSPTVRARKIVMVIAAVLMLAGIPAFLVRSSATALALISVVLLAFTGWASNSFSLMADLFDSYEVGQVTGLTGTSAAIGGMLFTLATGWLAQNVSYGSVFIASSGMIVCAAAIVVWVVPRDRAPA